MVLESFQKESEIDTRSENEGERQYRVECELMENSFGENRKKTYDRKLKAKVNIYVLEKSHKNTLSENDSERQYRVECKKKDGMNSKQTLYRKLKLKNNMKQNVKTRGLQALKVT